MKPVRLASCAILLSLSALAVHAAHAADSAPLKRSNGRLVDARGMTVYTFDKDTANDGKSACNGRCAENWPPVRPSEGPAAAPYSIVTREDGSRQLAYKGKPLYTFVKDKQPGDREGDKAMNVWHAVDD